MPTKKETKKIETDKPFPIILDKDIQKKANAKSKKYQNNLEKKLHFLYLAQGLKKY